MPTPSWNPFSPAVSVETAPESSRIAVVRHHGYPYQDSWDGGASGWDGLFEVANRYLTLANQRLQLPQAWLDNLLEQAPGDPAPPVELHWLRDPNDPRHSYWVRRQGGLDAPSRPKTGPVLDRTAVLLAGLWFSGLNNLRFPLLGGQGLRVIVQVGPSQAKTAPVRITGVTSTLPKPTLQIDAKILSELVKDVPTRVARVFALPSNVAVVDFGVRVPSGEPGGEPTPVVFARTAPLSADPAGTTLRYDETSFLLALRANPDAPGSLEPLAARPLIASADAEVYVEDPISRDGAAQFTPLRPSRSWTVLDPERDSVTLGNLPPGGSGFVQLVDPDPDPDFQVTNVRLVDPPLLESAPKEVPASVDVHVRTNTFAAVDAFYHVGQLFALMRSYGLSSAEYFTFVERPIAVRYRAGISPGFGDGRTTNAQVRWTLRPTQNGPSKGIIEVCFALGDLESAVGRLPANMPSAAERSPLGVASDPRWCWHEACHVLLTAATASLEFGFCHSAGDAMAAILSDPESQLARDRDGVLANDGPWRGVTFPWVLIPRRHDRDARDGWSWTGPLNRREVYFVVPGLSDKRGYWVEQILSSSLFRLYRAIGGDSQDPTSTSPAPDKAARGNAALYAVYLIMRAIKSLGPTAAISSTIPSDFVQVMRAVDEVTASPGPGGYVGGAVNKVIQWAFERQGLYALPAPGSSVAGPEEPVAVDLHIEDQRPKPDGVYSPVDLLGTGWQADPGALWITKWFWSQTRRIHVRVQNRGATAAASVRVDAWVAQVTGGVIPAFPDATTWSSLGNDTRSVPGASATAPGHRKFGPFEWTAPDSTTPQVYAILVAATCDEDRSNIDPSLPYPCVTVAGPTNILVACDNNLGLITVPIAATTA